MKYIDTVKKFGQKLAVLPVAAFVAADVHAELPTAVGTSLTALKADAEDLLDLLYPAMLAIAGGFIVFGLVKKGMRRAAS